MLIGITGLQGCGKSTLARELHYVLSNESGHEWQLVPSVGEILKTRGYDIGEFADISAQHLFATVHLERIRHLNDASYNAILDRCPLDHLAYFRALNLGSAEYKSLQTELVEWGISAIDLIVICGELDQETQPPEHESIKFRERVKIEMESLIDNYSDICISVEGTVSERVSTIINHLKAGQNGQ